MKATEALDTAELQEAIDTLAAGDDDSASLASLRSKILNELSRRLSDDKLVAQIPGTALLSLAKEVIRDKASDPEEQLPRDPTVTQILSAVNVPDVRKLELLSAELVCLNEDIAACEAAIATLEER